MCKFLAPNKKPSKLFDTLVEHIGAGNAVANYNYVNTKEFKTWYGAGSTTSDGEPIIVEGHYVNDTGDKRSLLYLEDAESNRIAEVLEASKNLQDIFKRVGVNVEVVKDNTISEMGYAVRKGDKVIVGLNLDKATKESAFHEFGHLYVDMLGLEDSVVKSALNKLKGSELWEKVERLNPELSPEDLAKEVLTTAIGIEAQTEFDVINRTYNKDISGRLLKAVVSLRFVLRRLIRKVGDLLGLSNKDASRLAWELTGGKLRSITTGKISTLRRYQKTSITELMRVADAIKKTPDEKYYISPTTGEELERVTNLLEIVVGQFDREAAARRTVASVDPLYELYDNEEEILKLWADKREEGTGIHQLFEDYIQLRNEGFPRDAIIAELLKDPPSPVKGKNGLDEDGIRIYSGTKTENLETYINTIADVVDDLVSKGYKLYPELVIHDDELGAAGTIDLLAIKDGKIHIFDFKTKEVITKDGVEYSKFDEFNSINLFKPKMLAFASDVDNTMSNKYAMQLSFYKLMLERKGFEVGDLHIIPIVGEIEKQGDEFHYKNLRLYKNSNMSNLSDLGFKINDHSTLINDTVFGKADIETQIEEAINTSEETENIINAIGKIEGIADWVRELVVDLEKSIVRVKRTKDKSTAAKYETAIKRLISQLVVTDELQAINAYTDYVGKKVLQIHQKLNGRLVITERDSAGNVVSTKYKNGYSSLSWAEIKELKNSDPEGYMDFLAFMINADHFISQAVKIATVNFTAAVDRTKLTDEELKALDNLANEAVIGIKEADTIKEKVNTYYTFIKEVNSKAGESLAILKEYEGKISDIEVSLTRLNKEVQRNYIDLSSNPLMREGDINKINEMFFKSQADETFMQANFDALADSHITFLANIAKLYDHNMYKYRQEFNNLAGDWQIDAKALGEDAVNELVDKNTGRFLERIDKAAWTEAMLVERQRLVDKYTYGTKPYWSGMNKWLVANTTILPKEERDALIAKRKEQLGDNYDIWYNKQVYKTKAGDTILKTSGAFYRPSDDYISKAYLRLSPKQLALLNKTKNLMAYVTDHVAGSIYDFGYAPAVPINDKKFWEQVKSSAGWRGPRRAGFEEVNVDEVGNVTNTLPFLFMNKLGEQEQMEQIPPGASADVKKQIAERNADIRAMNEARHAAATNLNLMDTIPMFLDLGLKHKYKSGMEFELWRARKTFIESHKLIKQKGGKTLIDKAKAKIGIDNTNVEVDTKGSKALNHLDDWMRMTFYEQFELDEGTWTKVSKVLQDFTSFKGMALNFMSAINNQAYGSVMSAIETGASEFFSGKDWRSGSWEYTTAIASFIADRNSVGEYSSLASAYTNKFAIMMDYKELSIDSGTGLSISNTVLNKMGWLASKAYFMEHMSEHNLQYRVLFAMLKSNRIVDGKIMSFNDYKRGKLIGIDAFSEDKEKTKKDIAANKETLKTLKEEFERNPTVWDSHELVDKRLVVKEGVTVNANEFANFERRVLGVNQYLHGIYNKEDAGSMQQYAVGRLAIQFRKWMRPGWNKRWGARAGESYWNERRAHNEEGYYVTTAKFLTRPFSRELERREDPDYAEQATTMKALSNIISDYKHFLTNVKVHWHSLNSEEKANVTRTMLEWAALSTAVGALYILKSIKGEDDDPPAPLMLALYQMDRTVTELTTYVPIAAVPGYVGGGWLNETKKILKSPTATFNSFEQLMKLGQTIMIYPFSSEEDMTYKTGVYHGEDKLKIQLTKMIPIYNQINRFEYLSRNYRYYKLF